MKKILVLIGFGVFLINLECSLFEKNFIPLNEGKKSANINLANYFGTAAVTLARAIIKTDLSAAVDLDKLVDTYASEANKELSSSVSQIQNAAKAVIEAQKFVKANLATIKQKNQEVIKVGISDTEAKSLQSDAEKALFNLESAASIAFSQTTVMNALLTANQAGTLTPGNSSLLIAQAAALAASNLATQHATDANTLKTAVASWKSFTQVPDISTAEAAVETAATSADTQKTTAKTASDTANAPTATLAIAQQGQKDAEAAEKAAQGFLSTARQNKALIDGLVKVSLDKAKGAAHVAKVTADTSVASATNAVTAAVIALKSSAVSAIKTAATAAETALNAAKTAAAQADTADKAATASTDLKDALTHQTEAEAATKTATDQAVIAQIEAAKALAYSLGPTINVASELASIDADITAVTGKVAAIQALLGSTKCTVPEAVDTQAYNTIMSSGVGQPVKDFLKQSPTNPNCLKDLSIQAALAKIAGDALNKAKTDATTAGVTPQEVLTFRMIADIQKKALLDAEALANEIGFYTYRPKNYCVITNACNFRVAGGVSFWSSNTTFMFDPIYGNGQGQCKPGTKSTALNSPCSLSANGSFYFGSARPYYNNILYAVTQHLVIEVSGSTYIEYSN